ASPCARFRRQAALCSTHASGSRIGWSGAARPWAAMPRKSCSNEEIEMKHGLTLNELAAEIARQAEAKKDYHVKTEVLRRLPTADGLHARGAPLATSINAIAHRQIGETVGIPAKYYDRMLALAPDLLATNVNRWFDKEPETRLVRTLDGRARALLIDKYRPLDNVDLAEAVLPALQKHDLMVMSCAITEQRLYIKA